MPKALRHLIKIPQKLLKWQLINELLELNFNDKSSVNEILIRIFIEEHIHQKNK